MDGPVYRCYRLPLLFVLFFCCFSTAALAQTGYRIGGTVADSAGLKVEDGIVGLFDTRDSSLRSYSVIDKGMFHFQDLPAGSYFLKVSCPGYEDKVRPVTLAADNVVQIVLRRTSVALKGVQVTGYSKSFSYKNGNIKVMVENSVLSSMADATEVLSKLPTVQVSGDRESVSVIGKGEPVIYLGNRQITVSELSAMPVSSIRSIEIINNPSSKYEAGARAVILVELKKHTREGEHADVTEISSMKRYFENRAGFNAAIQRKKTELKCNFQYNQLKRFEGLDGVVNSDANSYQSGFNGTSIGPRRQYLYGVGIFRQLADDGYVSLNVNGRLQNEHAAVNTSSYLVQRGGDTSVLTRVQNENSRPFFNANFNYLKKFSGNSELFVGGQYSRYTIDVTSNIFNNYDNTEFLQAESRQQHFAVGVGSARVDFDKAFGNGMKLEAGGLVNISSSSTIFDIDYIAALRSAATYYTYREDNEAAYAQLSGTAGKVSYSAGLRAEHTGLQGGYRDSSRLVVSRDFTVPFPKLGVSIPLDSSATLGFNYSRSIRRPNYANANQVTNYINPFLERSNNINLNPAITDEAAVNIQYKGYSLTATAYRTADPSWYITDYDTVLHKLRLINENLAVENGASLALALPFAYKVFSSTNEAVATLRQIKDPRGVPFKAAPYYYLYSNNQLRLPRHYTVVLAGWITTNQYEGIFQRRQQFAVDISVSKVLREKLTVTINAFDIFRSLNYVEAFNVNGVYSSTTYLENMRELSVSLKYSIGRIKAAKFKNREVGENGGRLN